MKSAMKYKTLKRNALGKYCRECINGKYGLRLSRKDCQYWMYPGLCSHCGEVRNIVTDVSFLSRWKLWGRNKK